jgi:rod shape determining protein RodA
MISSQGDFVRSMPDVAAAGDFARKDTVLRRVHLDGPLLVGLIGLISIGLFVLYSASGQSMSVVYRQGSFFAIGFTAMLVVAQIDLRAIRRLSYLAYAVGILLLIAVFFFGVGAKGATRWLAIGGLPRFQPSELMKLALPMTVAAYLANRALPPSPKHVFFSAVFIMVPTLLIASQPDLGTSLLIAASGVFVLFLAGLGWAYIGSVIALITAMSPIFWFYILHDYQKQRILTLINPEADKLGSGWNIIQSKTAIGSGGVNGKGWLNGTQSQLDFLPESHTDFIIAVLAEELGLVGVLGVICLYLFVIGRGLIIGLRSQDMFSRLVVGSITLTFFVYVFVNMGMVSGLLPVVGVPLPFISQGGTSVVTLLAGFGVLMAASTEAKRITR